MAKEEFKTLDEKIVEILKAPDGYGTLFVNVLDIKEFISRLRKWFYSEEDKRRFETFLKEELGEKLTPLETKEKTSGKVSK